MSQWIFLQRKFFGFKAAKCNIYAHIGFSTFLQQIFCFCSCPLHILCPPFWVITTVNLIIFPLKLVASINDFGSTRILQLLVQYHMPMMLLIAVWLEICIVVVSFFRSWSWSLLVLICLFLTKSHMFQRQRWNKLKMHSKSSPQRRILLSCWLANM